MALRPTSPPTTGDTSGPPSALVRWFLTGIPDSLHMEAQDRVDFIAEVRQKFGRDIYLITAMVTFFNLAYWFTDAWLMAPIPGAAETFVLGRTKLIALAVVVVIVHSLAPSRVYLTGLLGGMAAFFVIGDLMGRIGPPSSAWFGFLYPFVLISIGQWLTPLQRVGALLAYGGAMLGGYFGANPAWLSDPLIGPSLGYYLYILAISYFVGLYVDYSKIRFFMTRRDLEQARAHLEERVEERTRAAAHGRRDGPGPGHRALPAGPRAARRGRSGLDGATPRHAAHEAPL